MNRPTAMQAFTLIELLVVITIIVVLLALLTPALDKAIYEAEMLQCAAKLKLIATTAATYATGNKRRYPDRGSDLQFSGGAARVIFHPFTDGGSPKYDLRRQLDGYLDINSAMNDPFVEPVDFEQGTSAVMFGSYGMYFGHSMAPAGGRGMMKLGEKWTYTSDDGKHRRFSVLALDHDLAEPDNDNANNHSHQDYDGTMVNFVWQGTLPTGTDGGLIPELDGAFNGKFVLSTWVGRERSLEDMNAVMEDGSAERFEKYVWNAGELDPGNPSTTRDPRFVRVVENVHDESPDLGYNNVPAR